MRLAHKTQNIASRFDAAALGRVHDVTVGKAAMNSRHVMLTIDTLVLRNFPAAQRKAITGSLRVELERLLAETAARDGFGPSCSLTALPAGRLRLSVHTSDRQVGALARGVRLDPSYIPMF